MTVPLLTNYFFPLNNDNNARKICSVAPHHALQCGISQRRSVPMEVWPHMQTGSQQVDSRAGLSH